MGRIFLAGFFLLLVFCPSLKASEATIPDTLKILPAAQTSLHISTNDDKKAIRRKRIKAALLTIALGPFGMHRLYLGTKPVVVVFYVFTLGGGLGIIPLIDLVAILATKDLRKYENNDRVFMWAQ
jgi:hypothetical protein